MTSSERDGPPTVEEARATLQRALQRLARGTGLSFSALVLAIVAVELVRVSRLVSMVGFSKSWHHGAAESLDDMLLLPILAVVVWLAGPRALAIGYGSLLREGRLVRATVVAGRETIAERLRLDRTLLGPIEAMVGAVLPTRLVNYRVEDSPTSLLGVMYTD